MNKFIIALLLFAIIGCKPNFGTISINDRIDKTISKELNNIEQAFFKLLDEGDIEAAKSILSPEMINATESNAIEYLKVLSDAVKGAAIETIDQFYIQNSEDNRYTSLQASHGFEVFISPINTKAFVSINKIHTTPYQSIVINMFTKHKEGWKLDMIQAGKYSIENKNSEDLLNLAQRKKEEGKLIEAYNFSYLATQLSHPADKVMRYFRQEEIDAYEALITNEIVERFQFPITLEWVETKPELINFYTVALKEGIGTAMTYVSSIPITQVKKLQIENDAVHQDIESILGGSDKDALRIVYTIINKIPEGDEETDYVQFSKM